MYVLLGYNKKNCITQYLSTPISATAFLHDYYISWKHMEKDINKLSWEGKEKKPQRTNNPVGWKLNWLYFSKFSKFPVAKHPVNCYVSTHLFHWRLTSRPLKLCWQSYLITAWSSNPDGEEYVQMSVKDWTRPTDIFNHSSIWSQLFPHSESTSVKLFQQKLKYGKIYKWST